MQTTSRCGANAEFEVAFAATEHECDDQWFLRHEAEGDPKLHVLRSADPSMEFESGQLFIREEFRDASCAVVFAVVVKSKHRVLLDESGELGAIVSEVNGLGLE